MENYNQQSIYSGTDRCKEIVKGYFKSEPVRDKLGFYESTLNTSDKKIMKKFLTDIVSYREDIVNNNKVINQEIIDREINLVMERDYPT